MSSFWLILKQQWTIEEIYIFSNSSHLEWRVGLSDTILKGTHPSTIPTRFGLIRFRGFTCESSRRMTDGRTQDGRRMAGDGKSSLGLWPDELKNHFRTEAEQENCSNSLENNKMRIHFLYLKFQRIYWVQKSPQKWFCRPPQFKNCDEFVVEI